MGSASKNTLPSKLRSAMEQDIDECRMHTEANGSEALYNRLVAKYSVVFPGFSEHLSTNGKAAVLGTEFDYRNELNAIRDKLEMLLIMDDCPDDAVKANPTDAESEEDKAIVFVVHGHDNAAKQEVARTLEKAGFNAIILHEQPDGGKTIIEKLEQFIGSSYAVILYTPCDLGRSKEDETDKPRARQNVVFEHGIFIGSLGRERVSALVKDGVETPGDLSGVVYTKMDSEGAWKNSLAKNMRAVGLNFDLNALL